MGGPPFPVRPVGRRPKRTTFDPAWLRNGEHGAQTATEDTYFADESTPALGWFLDELVSQLDVNAREAIELTVFGRLSYRQAAEHLKVDPKTVWRRAQRGLSELASRLSMKELAAMLDDHVSADLEEIPGLAKVLSEGFALRANPPRNDRDE